MKEKNMGGGGYIIGKWVVLEHGKNEKNFNLSKQDLQCGMVLVIFSSFRGLLNLRGMQKKYSR